MMTQNWYILHMSGVHWYNTVVAFTTGPTLGSLSGDQSMLKCVLSANVLVCNNNIL